MNNEESIDTIYVNFFAGPSTGKSTSAAGLFYFLKQKGINCEIISEYAKDKVWGEDFNTLQCQPYILAKQFYKQYRLLGKVDVAITDSPLLFSSVYKGFGCVDGFDELVLKQFKLFNNFNINLIRDTNRKYNPKGRMQNKQTAMALDGDIIKILNSNNILYHNIHMTDNGDHLMEIMDILFNAYPSLLKTV